ncbi:MAG: MBL fold metallo-hydrolase [Spirochaetaceae bacterium]|jgi:phosphoribosyl 1,2-cyclic phosphate phosphodiesterase|nr:MBL fold metallo-hydrolase [Spirochaetaceae bacterium]
MILGSGTSYGVPVIGCSCAVCRSADTRDRRTRSSLYIEGGAGERVVIDTGPEFRLQALGAGITGLDCVLLTHAHADHLHGLDDVRPLCRERPLAVYGNRQTLDEVRERFSYAFRETQKGGGKPRIVPCEAREPVRIGALLFTPVPVRHGDLEILGWKVREEGGAAREAVYLTDTSLIPEPSFRLIGQPDVAVIGGLRALAHETHFSFEEALQTGVRIGAREIYLTHICHDHSHEEITALCRRFRARTACPAERVEPVYDGCVIR